ncbi:isoleucyl-tRNA synthetase [Hokovirus HKV1]|uniref:isoleucine--tRNA ligase n=1 Tax=Hokovirus HKV1 TaxID=1977638 RepID=A0A1V0SGW1_9VIRU|nr:isoleucyl-tRNA synthetase [Hokovirus HKV1]
MDKFNGPKLQDMTSFLQDLDILDIYNKLIQSNNELQDNYYFVDGPPFVNSPNLHWGHILVASIKDTILRHVFKTGKNINIKLGYDCHGLPIEMAAIKYIDITESKKLVTRKDFNDYGIDKFNNVCLQLIATYSQVWTAKKGVYSSMGRLYDPNDNYKTCNQDFMNIILKIFKQMHDLNLVYLGYKIMPYSTACCSVISNSEADNYKNINTLTCYVKIKPLVSSNNKFYNSSLLVWTTTPWTLPCNVVLCVNPDKIYVKVLYLENLYILMESQLNIVFDKNNKYEIVEKFLGSELLNIKYERIFNYYNLPQFFRIISDNWVDESGTGIVHISPGFGQIDFETCLKNNIINISDIGNYDLCPIDEEGKFTEKIKEYYNTFVLDSNKSIVEYLKNNDKLFKTQVVAHKYPMCPRTDTPLIYRATEAIFIKIEPLRQKMLDNCKKVNWCPKHIVNKMIQWISESPDWCVSRKRYFGTPICYFKSIGVVSGEVSNEVSNEVGGEVSSEVVSSEVVSSEVEGEVKVFGSVEELESYANVKITDLHNDVRNLKIYDSKGRLMELVGPYVFDCWFESGSVSHYLNCDNPDFICEGLDQTRGWFYSLMVIHSALKDTIPYKNVMCAGILANEKGEKFSKRLANYSDPVELVEKYSADTIRLYLINSAASRGCETKFNMTDIENINKKIIQFLEPLKFLIISTELFKKNYDINELNLENYNLTNIDKWILSRVDNFKKDILYHLNNYNTQIFPIFESLINDLNNIYIRIIRNRIKNGNYNERLSTILVLANTLINITIITSSFLPFYSEYIYKAITNLNIKVPKEYAQLCHYKDINNIIDLESQDYTWISKILNVIKLVNRLRSDKLISLKKPLLNITVYNNLEKFQDITELLEQTNSLDITYKNILGVVNYKVKPNNKTIGEVFGKKSNLVKQYINKNIDNIIKDKFLNYDDDGFLIVLDNTYFDIELELINKNDKNILIDQEFFQAVSIDTQETQLIMDLYTIRLLMNSIQKYRKFLMLQEWNKILIHIEGSDDFYELLDNYANIIATRIKYSINKHKPDNNDNYNCNETFEPGFNKYMLCKNINGFDIKIYIDIL